MVALETTWQKLNSAFWEIYPLKKKHYFANKIVQSKQCRKYTCCEICCLYTSSVCCTYSFIWSYIFGGRYIKIILWEGQLSNGWRKGIKTFVLYHKLCHKLSWWWTNQVPSHPHISVSLPVKLGSYFPTWQGYFDNVCKALRDTQMKSIYEWKVSLLFN